MFLFVSFIFAIPSAVWTSKFVIEAHETHTRTGFITIPSSTLAEQGILTDKVLEMPVTHAKIFGWYDNELGSYVNCLSRLTNYIEEKTL